MGVRGMPVGFAFEPKIGVGTVQTVSTPFFVYQRQADECPKQAHEPRRHVPNVEGQVAHLAHLPGVDAFVAQHLVVNRGLPPDEQHAAEVHGREAGHRDEAVADNLHRRRGLGAWLFLRAG